MSKNNNKKKDITNNNVIVSNPEKMIPKFCSSINFSQLETGSIIMSFISRDVMPVNQNIQSVQNILIERIAIDKQHAKDIANKLLEMTNTNE